MTDMSTATAVRPRILCVMRMPPDLNGHGGSQRMWYLLDSLLPHGEVHFVLVHREQDWDCSHATLTSLPASVASITRICIAGWQCTHEKHFGVIPPGVWNILKMRSQEAPRLSSKELASIAERLPIRHPDFVFAGRVCTAYILQSLMRHRLLKSTVNVVDFDDIMSKFRQRQLRDPASGLSLKKRLSARFDARVIAQAEADISHRWHGVSVCTDEDTAALRSATRDTAVQKVPNVIERPHLAAREDDGRFKILFVGNLGFAPNIAGLRLFIEEGWPRVRDLLPEAALTVVGLNPDEEIVGLCERNRVAVHANAPSVLPYYQDCDAVIAPILFGSGTRIKILEAMAYGRAVVSTSMGAEGMELEDGRHLLLADNMNDFAAALVRLARDRALRESLVAEARSFQVERYAPKAIRSSVQELLRKSTEVALTRRHTSAASNLQRHWA